jgi:uncharacterized membrane protein YczE
MLTAGLGVNSWDVLHQGVAELTELTFGWVVTGVSLLVGTVFSAVSIGPLAQFFLARFSIHPLSGRGDNPKAVVAACR